MTFKLLVVAALPVLLVAGVAMNASILIVNVHDDDINLTIPVPVTLAQVLLAFAPDEVKRISCPEAVAYIPGLRKAVDTLRTIPDAELVMVDDGDDHVTIVKEGGVLRIDVLDGGNEAVHLRVPLAAVDAILAAYDEEGGYFRTSRIVGALRAAPSGRLVHVLDGDDEVSVRIW